MVKENEKQVSGLNNLKTIHNIQKSGEIQDLLRSLRSSKNQLNNNLQNIADAKKKNSKTAEKPEENSMAQAFDAFNAEKSKAQAAKNNARRDFNNQNRNFANGERSNQNGFNRNREGGYNNQNRTYSNDRNAQNSFNRNRDGGYNKPNQNGYNNQNRTYSNDRNSQGGFNQTRTFNNDRNSQGGFNRNNQGGYNQNRTYSNDRNSQGGYNQSRTFANGERPFGSQNQQNRPFAKSNNFVSSKGNSFKKFEPTESASVLATPERSFGNKNKSNRNYDDRKQQTRKNQTVRRGGNNINTLDFDADRMGSRKLIKNKKKEEVKVAAKIDHAVITTESISVKILSEKTGRAVAEIIKQLMILGVMANINSTIDFGTAELICSELGVTLEQKIEKTYEEQMIQNTVDKSSDTNTEKRPPVVTVMGHVDHGKTSLLDAIRKTNVIAGEAGGITQKIGAYQIEWNNNKITFIDTPGHAAFTSMRARGAKVTDIAILVVAADDGIMPQTVEAINHIKLAGVPMIVAINKIDKVGANIDRIKTQLAEHDVMPEEWGGDAILVPISAKNNTNIDELLKTILLVSEVNEYKANPNTAAVAVVIEAELDKNRGPVASVLVENGTLKVGDTIMCGVSFGKVRALFDENGKNVKTAGPSTPVMVLGLDSVPNSGDKMFAANEKLSKNVIEERIAIAKNLKANSTSGVSLEDFMDKVNEGKLKTLNIIIKADVQGSVEALKQSLVTLKNEEARVNCIHSAAGPVTESDVILASAANAIIINFNLKLNAKIEQIADASKVQIRSYKIIYEVMDEITKAINGMLTIKYEEKVVGNAEVRQMFKLSSYGLICGSYVTDGKIHRNDYVNVYRGDELILNSSIEALKIQKDDKAEINYGYECGIKLKDASGVAVGDRIEVYQKVEIKRA